MDKRVGVHDSRSIAMAYAGSPRHEAELEEVLAKVDVTGEEDADVVMSDERHGIVQEACDRACLTESGDDLPGRIRCRLPGIMKLARVTAIASKWDEKRIKKHAGSEQVDATMVLVDVLDPIPSQRETAQKIQERLPLD